MKNKQAKSKSEDITVPVGAMKNVSSIKDSSNKLKTDESGLEKTKKARSGAIDKICFLKITDQVKTKSL